MNEIARELLKIARELKDILQGRGNRRTSTRVAGSDTAADALYTSRGSIKHVRSDIVKIREELRQGGNERYADQFYLNADKALKELAKSFEKAAKY